MSSRRSKKVFLMILGAAAISVPAFIYLKKRFYLRRPAVSGSGFSPKLRKNAVNQSAVSLSKRESVIMESISGKGRITVPELAELFPDITQRTLRRDMDKLVDRGLISRRGNTKSTIYLKK